MLDDVVPLAGFSSQRRFPRFQVDRPVSAVVNWADLPLVAVPGRCRVLGEGGLGAVMNRQFRVGEVLCLEFSGIRVYGAVRNLSGMNHGFEFVLVKDVQREAIRRLCQSFRAEF